MLLITLGCEEQIILPLQNNEVFKFPQKTILIYKSNDNELDTAIVDTISHRVYGENISSWNKYVSEHMEVTLHFTHDQQYIDHYDSIRGPYYDCRRKNHWDYCDSLYNLSEYDLYVRFFVEHDSRYNGLDWKKLPYFRLRYYDNNHEMVISGKSYNGVFILERDTAFKDPMIQVKRIYYNYEYGILRYENLDSSIYDLQFPVQ